MAAKYFTLNGYTSEDAYTARQPDDTFPGFTSEDGAKEWARVIAEDYYALTVTGPDGAESEML